MAIMKRQTSQRTALEQVFRREQRPLTIEDILKQGRKLVRSLNQATVYRNLKVLIETGWLRQIHHPALGALFERAELEHHHHFHCRACDRLFDLPVCAFDESTAVPSGFVTKGHEVFLFGSCPSCAITH
jgi:Fur family transcriptional regulator, ferric uptake regulator